LACSVPRLVRNEDELADFRRRHGGRDLLDRLPAAGAALVTWPVGVGKSHAIDEVIEAALDDTSTKRVGGLSCIV